MKLGFLLYSPGGIGLCPVILLCGRLGSRRACAYCHPDRRAHCRAYGGACTGGPLCGPHPGQPTLYYPEQWEKALFQDLTWIDYYPTEDRSCVIALSRVALEGVDYALDYPYEILNAFLDEMLSETAVETGVRKTTHVDNRPALYTYYETAAGDATGVLCAFRVGSYLYFLDTIGYPTLPDEIASQAGELLSTVPVTGIA